MVYTLQLLIPFGTVARRDSAIIELQDQISTRSRWGIESIEATTSKIGDPAVLADLRFIVEDDTDAVEQWLRNRLTGPRIPRDGAWVQVHRCRHDEDNSEEMCVPLRRFEVIAGSWQRII